LVEQIIDPDLMNAISGLIQNENPEIADLAIEVNVSLNYT